MKRLLVLLFALSTLGACRNLVTPGDADELEARRQVTGTILGLDGFETSTAAVKLRQDGDGDVFEANVFADSTGAFDLALPPGIDGTARLHLRWIEPVGLPSFTLFDLPLRGRTLDIPYEPLPVVGSVRGSGGAAIEWEQASMDFEQDAAKWAGFFPLGTQSTTVGETGSFETVLAPSDWTLTLGASATSGADSIAFRAWGVAAVETLDLELPITMRPTETLVRGGFPASRLVATATSRPFADDPVVLVRHDLEDFSEPGSRWWPVDLGEAELEFLARGPEDVVVAPLGAFLRGDLEDPDGPIQVDAGRAVVRILVRDGVTPLADVPLEIVIPQGLFVVRTGEAGEVWITQDPGWCRVEVAIEPGRTFRQIEVETRSDLVIDVAD